ncbi:hypothetical protein VP01_773g2 [Puccinia sorghi]|uniref:Uncharacterized protein n=1 Tax=Puccinia sorghi TaxID=27349 RepID=A0A0L6UBH0_9BASI|nr:hypothetical protein VP01_773g2 [Puccinia sorghi]
MGGSEQIGGCDCSSNLKTNKPSELYRLGTLERVVCPGSRGGTKPAAGAPWEVGLGMLKGSAVSDAKRVDNGSNAPRSHSRKVPRGSEADSEVGELSWIVVAGGQGGRVEHRTPRKHTHEYQQQDAGLGRKDTGHAGNLMPVLYKVCTTKKRTASRLFAWGSFGAMDGNGIKHGCYLYKDGLFWAVVQLPDSLNTPALVREGREGATSEEEDSAPTATLIVLAHARKQFLFFLFVFWWMGGTVYCCVCACVSAEGRNAITDAHVPTRAILYKVAQCNDPNHILKQKNVFIFQKITKKKRKFNINTKNKKKKKIPRLAVICTSQHIFAIEYQLSVELLDLAREFGSCGSIFLQFDFIFNFIFYEITLFDCTLRNWRLRDLRTKFLACRRPHVFSQVKIHNWTEPPACTNTIHTLLCINTSFWYLSAERGRDGTPQGIANTRRTAETGSGPCLWLTCSCLCKTASAGGRAAQPMGIPVPDDMGPVAFRLLPPSPRTCHQERSVTQSAKVRKQQSDHLQECTLRGVPVVAFKSKVVHHKKYSLGGTEPSQLVVCMKERRGYWHFIF